MSNKNVFLIQLPAMNTTVGLLDPPLGAARLQVAKLMPMLLLTNTHALNVELANLGTLSTLMVSTKIIKKYILKCNSGCF